MPSIPIDRIIQMRSQGLTNDQIAQSLIREGFTNQQIYDAMSQADVKNSIQAPMSAQQMSNPMQIPNIPSTDSIMEKVEEVAEVIIEEKWNALVKDVNKIIDWKEQMDSKITELNTVISKLHQDFQNLQSSIYQKVGEYDSHISTVGTELKALEMVFQKTLPTFTENVNELSRIAKVFRK